MFFVVMAAIIGTIYYVVRIVWSKTSDRIAKKAESAQISARLEEDRNFTAIYMDEQGSMDFRNMFPMNYEFSQQVCEEGRAILRNIFGPDYNGGPYPVAGKCDGPNHLLAAFLHFIPTGKAYSWWVIALGPKPFGMSEQDAEKVMRWGLRYLRERYNIHARIIKGWDTYNCLKYGWTVPLGVTRWIVIE